MNKAEKIWSMDPKNEDISFAGNRGNRFGMGSFDKTAHQWLSKGKILDVGCGAGKYSTALSDDCFKIVGTDLSPKMIESAQKGQKNMKRQI